MTRILNLKKGLNGSLISGDNSIVASSANRNFSATSDVSGKTSEETKSVNKQNASGNRDLVTTSSGDFDEEDSNDFLTPGGSNVVSSGAGNASSATSDVSGKTSEETKRINEQIESYLKEDWDRICENLTEIEQLFQRLKNEEKVAEYLSQISDKGKAAKKAGEEIDQEYIYVIAETILRYIPDEGKQNKVASKFDDLII